MKKFILNFARVIFSMTIRFEDFDFDNILIVEKSNGNVLIYNISYRTLIGPTPLLIRFDKIDEFIRVYNGTRYLISFGLDSMMPFAIELDTL